MFRRLNPAVAVKREAAQEAWQPKPQVVPDLYGKQEAVTIIMQYLSFQGTKSQPEIGFVGKYRCKKSVRPEWSDEAAVRKKTLDAIATLSNKMRESAFSSDIEPTYRVNSLVRDLVFLAKDETIKEAATKALRAAGY